MTAIDIEIIVILVLILIIAAAAYYNPSQSRIVTAKRTNDSLASIQRIQSLMNAGSLLRTFEKSLGPIFQEALAIPIKRKPKSQYR